MTVWEQLTEDIDRKAQTNDDYFFGVLVDSSIVAAGPVTDVQINFAGAASSGTVHVCRWDNLATISAENNAADLLTAANHTYWSKDATTIGTGMTNESVTQSTANVSGNIIGLVLTGSASDSLWTRFWDAVLTGYTTYKSNSGSTDEFSRTLTFTITATDSPISATTTTMPPPPAWVRL